MELAGSVEIAAPQARLWAALNDPDVLARCIDGVERLTRTDDGQPVFEGEMQAKVGPVRARFAGTVRLEDIEEPHRYRLVGEGKGGVAGFARGSADVQLTALSPASTRLEYQVKANVGGKLAQLGARLIEGAARQYAEGFFAKLAAEVEQAEADAGAADVADAAAQAPPATETPPETPAGGGLPPLVWGAGLIAAVLAFLAWQWA
jgi:hypothetical protein